MRLSFLYTNQKGETKKVRGYIVSTFEYVGPGGEPLGTYGHRIQTDNCEHVKSYKEVAMWNVTIVETETETVA